MTTIRELSEQDLADIKARIARGDKYSDIASDYRLNQGRIADIKFGRIRPDVEPNMDLLKGVQTQGSLF